MTDFMYFLKKANAKTYKEFSKEFRHEDEDDFEERIKTVIESVTFEGSEQAEKLSSKLSLYVIAHRNYLKSIPIDDFCQYKVNWGLKQIKKLEEQQSTT